MIASAGKASIVQNVPAGLAVFSELAQKWKFARQMHIVCYVLTDGSIEKKVEMVESGKCNGIKSSSIIG